MYPELIERIVYANPQAYRELTPSAGPTREAQTLLTSTSVEDLFPAMASPVHAWAVLAALWLRNDDGDAAHEIVQQSPRDLLAPTEDSVRQFAHAELAEMEATLAFWHGIIHRRETDYGNAKYWFHRVGAHPVYEELLLSAKKLAEEMDEAPPVKHWTSWDAFQFVDFCHRAAAKTGSLRKFCETVMLREWELLFAYCYQRASGAS